jgi:phosphomannomutase
MSNNNKIFLFDLDGTLSESRKLVSPKLAFALRDLTKYGKIGIVSGSDYNFIKEQMVDAWQIIPCNKIIILPCNGTKKYVWNNVGINANFVLTHELLMKEHIGSSIFAQVLQQIFKLQINLMETLKKSSNFSGSFITYRGSMINWAPFGRDGNEKDRNDFIKYDKELDIRKKYIKKLENFCKSITANVMIALGGDTSFDIFPVGWDKTVSLRFFNENDEIYFFGDRCYKGGNDFEIYEHFKTSKRSYSVKSPEETYTYIRELLETFK